MVEAATVTVPVIPSVSSFLPTLERALAPALAKLKTDFTSAGGGLAQAFSGVGIAAGAIFAGLSIKGVTAFQDIAGEVRILETQLGTTADQASILRAQAEAVGVSTTSLSTGFGILAKHITANDAVLAQYGVQVAQTADGQVNFGATLLNLSDIFQAMPPGLDRTAAAMNLFGRSGKALLPLLSASSSELAGFAANAEAAGLVMSEQDVQASRDFAIAQRELGAAFQGIAVSLGRALIPLLTSFADGLRIALNLVGPFLPQIRNLFVAFLAYKALTFIPTLFEDMATAFEKVQALSALSIPLNVAAGGLLTVADLGKDVIGVLLGMAGAAPIAAGAFVELSDKLNGSGQASVAQAIKDFDLQPLVSQIAKANPTVKTFADQLAVLAFQTQQGFSQEQLTGTLDRLNTALHQAGIEATVTYRDLLILAGGSFDAALAMDTLRTDTAKAVETTRVVLHSFGSEIDSLATLTGTSSRGVAANITGMVRDVKAALHKDDVAGAAKAWSHGIASELSSAKEALRTLATNIAGQLGFASDAFSQFVGDSSVSLHEFEGKLDHALTAQKRFTSDLTTLLDSGGKGFKLLGQQFLDAGAAGAARLHQLVNAPKDVQAAFARLARTSNSLATSASQVLAHKLGGTLKDIRGFFDDLTRALEKKLHIDIDGSDIVTSKKEADALGKSILNLTKTPFVVTAKADTSAADNAFQSFVSKWAGTQITLFGLLNIGPVNTHATGFHGQVTKPTLMLVGEKGSERVDVTPGGDTGAPSGPSGPASLRIDWRHNRGDLQGELDQLDRAAR